MSNHSLKMRSRILFKERKRSPEVTLKTAGRLIEAGMNTVSRTQKHTILCENNIVDLEQHRKKISEILEEQEEKLMQMIKPMQAIERVRFAMQAAVKGRRKLRLISEELEELIIKSNESIQKLETEINIFQKMKFLSPEMKQNADKTLSEMQHAIKRTEEIMEEIIIALERDNYLQERYGSLTAKAKDIIESY